MIHVSAPHKMLGVPAIPAVTVQFPQAKVVNFDNQPTALIPHAFREVQLLRGLGFVVPAPVLTQYAWPHPHGEPPFDVQRQTVAMMTTNQRGYILNGMGTGKTRCILWAYDYLRSVGLARKMLIVAPLSTLDFVWRREAFKVFPHLRTVVLTGTRAKRAKLLKQEADIYIINPDGLKVIQEELRIRLDIDAIAIDELAVFRNSKAEKNKLVRELVRARPWAWGATGSPTPEEPTDAYGQCLVLTPSSVPPRFSFFRDMTMTCVSQFRYVPRAEAKDVVYRVMQPAVRFTLDDVIELPEVVERIVEVPLGTKQTEVYEALRKDAYAMVADQEITGVNAGALLTKMLQASIGYLYGTTDDPHGPKRGEREVLSLDNEARLDRLVDDITACGNKVIVFAPFTHAIHGICERLAAEKIAYEFVDGSVPGSERGRIFNLFQNTDNPKVLVAHPGCMAHGVTLTRADTIIWFGPIASLEVFEQANARIRRIGQKLKQLILMYAGTKVEHTTYKKLREKQKVQDGVLAMFANSEL